MSTQWTRSEVAPGLHIRIVGCGGDVDITGSGERTLIIAGDDDLERYIREAEQIITIAGYPGDLELQLPAEASLELDGIAGDVEVRPRGEQTQVLTQFTAQGIGGDLSLTGVARAHLETIGGDVELHGACEEVTLGHIGGDLTADSIASFRLGAAGGDVILRQVGRLSALGNIGGDLELALTALEADSSGTIGGDATLTLDPATDALITAFVGGEITGSGEGWNVRRGPGRISLRFGEGQRRLQLTVGGDLVIRGGRQAEQQSSPGEWGGFEDLRGLGRELEELGRTLARDLGNLGREIAREVRIAGREARREMREELHSSFGRRPRIYGRFNEHEFVFDPEQIERIKREARAAAAAGIAKAQEAVEQALRHFPPRPPVPGQPPRPPARPYTGQTVRIDRAAEAPSSAESTPPASPADRDAQRLAILSMVHEGRLAPEEAEILLRGLES
ncbi:hypothetical protein [Kallotenue papyrolyticum]|uniref:hypothetical protein n=1 Tax=Kallotenue papyrolyticum TaxID=1325125 RepID=UPI000478597C|nr:hypothetical protein [Kallotenue papyrolyticum]